MTFSVLWLVWIRACLGCWFFEESNRFVLLILISLKIWWYFHLCIGFYWFLGFYSMLVKVSKKKKKRVTCRGIWHERDEIKGTGCFPNWVEVGGIAWACLDDCQMIWEEHRQGSEWVQDSNAGFRKLPKKLWSSYQEAQIGNLLLTLLRLLFSPQR